MSCCCTTTAEGIPARMAGALVEFTGQEAVMQVKVNYCFRTYRNHACRHMILGVNLRHRLRVSMWTLAGSISGDAGTAHRDPELFRCYLGVPGYAHGCDRRHRRI